MFPSLQDWPLSSLRNWANLKQDTPRERQIFWSTKYIMAVAISDISKTSPTRMIYAKQRSIISKCFHLSSAPPQTMFPVSLCFHFTAAPGKACFAQTADLGEFLQQIFRKISNYIHFFQIFTSYILSMWYFDRNRCPCVLVFWFTDVSVSPCVWIVPQ